MSLRRVYGCFVSAKVTVVLLCLLGLLLLLNVAVPQVTVLGQARFDEFVEERGRWVEFLLVDLGLGRMPTSPLFLIVLGLFFLNLALVLAARIGPTLRRTIVRPRSAKGLDAWTRLEENLTGRLSRGWGVGHVAGILRGFGYQPQRPGERAFWAVKHRTAPIGFLMFHFSFFLLCVGGTLLYYTRFVGYVVLTEGQEFRGEYSSIDRTPPLGGPPDLRFALERVDPRFEHGDPVHLGATFLMSRSGAPVRTEARVNHPARWGRTSLLVNEAGLASVLWLQDASGFTVDRVVAPARTRGGQPTQIPLHGGRLVAFVYPLADGEPFPARDDLQRGALRLVVTDQSRVVFDGVLRRGDAAPLEQGRLVLEELRYWAGVRVVSERGAGFLVAGFIVGLLGLVWRLLLYRREIALTWDDRAFYLVGRSEYFSHHFEVELAAIRSELERNPEEPRAAGRAVNEREGKGGSRG